MSESRMSTDPVVLTTVGRDHLQQRLVGLREAAAEALEQLHDEHGPDEVATHERLSDEVAQLETMLARAVVVEDVDEDPSIVEIGDEVTVEMPDGTTESFAIVHPAEAMVDDDRISSEAPVARAVLGRRLGDRVSVQAPAGVYAVVVVGRRRLS